MEESSFRPSGAVKSPSRLIILPRGINGRSPLKSLVHAVIWTAALALVAGCSNIVGKKPSPEAAATVISVAANYLGNVAGGQVKNLSTTVMWGAYLKESKENFSRQDYLNQLASLQKKFKPTEHPLLGMDISSVDIDDDDAEVVFRKAGSDAEDEVSVKLHWNGTGWLVIDDSLFGRNGQIARWTTDQSPSS